MYFLSLSQDSTVKWSWTMNHQIAFYARQLIEWDVEPIFWNLVFATRETPFILQIARGKTLNMDD